MDEPRPKPLWQQLLEGVGIFAATDKGLDQQTKPQAPRVGSDDEQKDAGRTFLGIKFTFKF